jgi:hypothetical protein
MDRALADFLESGVVIIMGTRDADLRPHVTRVCGARVSDDRRDVRVFISRSQGDECLGDLRDNGAVAVTFSRPTDYTTYQAKGSLVAIEEVAGDDRAWIANYLERITEVFTHVGFEPRKSARFWLDDLVAVRFRVEHCYSQTPGPGAGAEIGD